MPGAIRYLDSSPPTFIGAGMSRASAGLVLAWAACHGAGCASEPLALSEVYRERDMAWRRMFLSYYPELTPERRLEVAAATAPASDFLTAWKVESRFYGEASSRISSVDVGWEAPDPLESGMAVRPRAILRYADGRSADATPDVLWSASPDLASFEEGEVRFECVWSDIVVSADFLGIRSGSRLLRIRKPLRRLDVGLWDPSAVVDNHGLLRLRATAHCEDGSSTDVSCQATWRNLAPAQEDRPVGRCGTVDAGVVSRGKNDTLRVRVTYGTLTTDFSAETPRRSLTR